jgi:uncharacterized protein
MTAPPKANDDPSMDDILASIRRVLNEDETVSSPSASTTSPASPANPANKTGGSDDVFLLDQSMMVAPQAEAGTQSANQPAPASSGAPGSGQSAIIAPAAAAAASSSVGQLVRQLSAERQNASAKNGTTVEQLVREAIDRPLAEWLNKHLQPLVERIVRMEIERVVNRAIADN